MDMLGKIQGTTKKTLGVECLTPYIQGSFSYLLKEFGVCEQYHGTIGERILMNFLGKVDLETRKNLEHIQDIG